MKKRVLALLLTGAMCLSLAACSDNSGGGADTGDSGAGSGGADAKNYRIALLMSHQTNAFTTAVSEGAKEKSEELGVTVDVFDGAQDQAKQASQMEQCITQGYDGILVEPISVDGIAPSVKTANEADVPVMTVVQKMSQQELAKSHCGGDDSKAGELQMQKAVEALGEAGNIVVLYGPMGSDAQIIRKEGYDKVLANYPNVHIVFEDTANWTTDEALTKVETWLQTGTEINAVVAQNDSMALGAQKAVEDAGKQDDIMVFGIDAVPEGIASVAAGAMDGTVSQAAKLQGALGVETMYRFLNGESVEALNYTECIWVTKDNASDYQ
ncbi:MAG: sugar ABC transporter substrate-binding protein [Eubacteriales bacterium]|nr:sugar ABC transporter substrate-binding protein [Eubacteriales bacterium]